MQLSNKVAVVTGSSRGIGWMLMRTLAVELAPHGITVNDVAPPGAVETPINENLHEEHPEQMQELLTQIPLGRTGQPEEVAGLVLYLASSMGFERPHPPAPPVEAGVLTARPINTAMTVREMSDCTIVSTFARRLKIAVSVGLKAVLVLKARKR